MIKSKFKAVFQSKSDVQHISSYVVFVLSLNSGLRLVLLNGLVLKGLIEFVAALYALLGGLSRTGPPPPATVVFVRVIYYRIFF